VTLTASPHLALPLPEYHDLLGVLVEPAQLHQPQHQNPQQATLLLTQCEPYPWLARKCQKPMPMRDQTPEHGFCQSLDATKAIHRVLCWLQCCLAGSDARHVHASSLVAGLHDWLSPATPLPACVGSEQQYWLSLFPGCGQCHPAAPAGHHLCSLCIAQSAWLSHCSL